MIAGMTIAFMFAAKFISWLMSVVWGKEDRILTDKEIEKYNIPTEAIEQEILDLFDRKK